MSMFCKIIFQSKTFSEGPEGGVPIPFPTWNFGKIPVPVGFLLEIPVRVIEIPVNKKKLFIGRVNS
jgi:hypothetical protein